MEVCQDKKKINGIFFGMNILHLAEEKLKRCIQRNKLKERIRYTTKNLFLKKKNIYIYLWFKNITLSTRIKYVFVYLFLIDTPNQS